METDLSKKEQHHEEPKETPAVKSKHWGAGDLVLSFFVMVFAVLMIIGALNFPRRARMGVITSPAFTPILLSILVIILCTVLIVVTFKKFGMVSIPQWFKGVIADEKMQRSFILIVIIGVYILLVGRIPFLIANIVFLAVMYWYLKIGSWKKVVLYSLASGVFVSLLVPYIFQMPLP